MKLTNYLRDAFITSVMNDVPEKDYSEEAQKVFTKAYLELLPKEIQTLWATPDLKSYLNTSYSCVCGQSFTLPSTSSGFRDIATPPKAQAKLAELKAQYDAQKTQHNALRSKVKGAAYACKTTKQLRELLPEFERYLPAEEEKTLRTLPVVQNIVSDFVKAGWPANKAKV